MASYLTKEACDMRDGRKGAEYTIGVVYPREAFVMPRKPGSQMMRTFDGWKVGNNLVGFAGGEDE